MSTGGAAPLGAVGSQPTSQTAPQGATQGTAPATLLPVGQSPMSPSQSPSNGPLGSPTGSTMGGFAGGMQPFSQQNLMEARPQLAQLAAQHAGGKGGMPGAQPPQGGFGSPPTAAPPMQQPRMQGGLASLLKSPPSSTNSLQ